MLYWILFLLPLIGAIALVAKLLRDTGETGTYVPTVPTQPTLPPADAYRQAHTAIYQEPYVPQHAALELTDETHVGGGGW